MRTSAEKSQARSVIDALERRLRQCDLLPAEALNAMLRVADYPLEHVMDFEPGSYPRETGRRIFDLAVDRLISFAAADTPSGTPDASLSAMLRFLELARHHLEHSTAVPPALRSGGRKWESNPPRTA